MSTSNSHKGCFLSKKIHVLLFTETFFIRTRHKEFYRHYSVKKRVKKCQIIKPLHTLVYESLVVFQFNVTFKGVLVRVKDRYKTA